MSECENSGNEMSSSSSDREAGPSKVSSAETGNANAQSVRMPKVIVFDLGVSSYIVYARIPTTDLFINIADADVLDYTLWPLWVREGYETSRMAYWMRSHYFLDAYPMSAIYRSIPTSPRLSNARKRKMLTSYTTAMANLWHFIRMSQAFCCSSKSILKCM